MFLSLSFFNDFLAFIYGGLPHSQGLEKTFTYIFY